MPPRNLFGQINTSIADTTRSPRPGELDGKDYYFVSREKFTSLIDENAFIEHAQFSGNFYGTSIMTVQNVSKSGRRCLLDIDSQVCRWTDGQRHCLSAPPRRRIADFFVLFRASVKSSRPVSTQCISSSPPLRLLFFGND